MLDFGGHVIICIKSFYDSLFNAYRVVPWLFPDVWSLKKQLEPDKMMIIIEMIV